MKTACSNLCPLVAAGFTVLLSAEFGTRCNTCARTMEGLAEKEAGNEAFRAGDTEKAIHFYSLAVDANPSEATFYSNRSAAFHKLGSYQKAQADAAMCIQLRSDWPKGYYRLGEAYFGQNLFAKASEEYSRALDLEPNDVGVREALARAEKALYNKVLEERVERPEPAAKPTGGRSKLIDYDSDEDDYKYETRERGQTATQSSNQSSGEYTSIEEKHKEILNRRLCQGTGISRLEDYMRYRSAGGGQLQQDETTGLMKVVAPEVKPSQSRSELLKSLGIDAQSPSADSTASPLSSGGPTSSSSSDPTDRCAQPGFLLLNLACILCFVALHSLLSYPIPLSHHNCMHKWDMDGSNEERILRQSRFDSLAK